MGSFLLFTLVFRCFLSIDVILLSFLWLDGRGLLGMASGRICAIWESWATLAGVWPAVLVCLSMCLFGVCVNGKQVDTTIVVCLVLVLGAVLRLIVLQNDFRLPLYPLKTAIYRLPGSPGCGTWRVITNTSLGG